MYKILKYHTISDIENIIVKNIFIEDIIKNVPFAIYKIVYFNVNK